MSAEHQLEKGIHKETRELARIAVFTVRHSISLDFRSPRQRQVNEQDCRRDRAGRVVNAQLTAYCALDALTMGES